MKRLTTIICLLLCFIAAMGNNIIRVDANKSTNYKKGIFRSVVEALRYAETLCARDTSQWTDILISPSVYWLDNPDDKEIRRPDKGESTPFAMKLRLNKVRLKGLSDNAEDVVLAVNRGQTQGADGNYTMLHITGNDVSAENITFGNYCNVDLQYPRNTKLNRAKRKDAIVQAQLAICHGDRYHFSNCRFISRLNLCPFVGVPHSTYENCYFECTDDALSGTGTYHTCRFTLFSSKPFYTTSGEGAKFYDCDIHCKTSGTQYFTKVSGPVQVHGCRLTSDDPDLHVAWNKRPDPRHYCVMTGCTLNGQPLNVPTPTEPLNRIIPALPLQVQTEVIPGQWTMDCYKPADTSEYEWKADNSQAAWGYAEGIDGAEGSWGLVQLQKGARLMLTPKSDDPVTDQSCTIILDPCKEPGQGFGSATGQYLDICIKFNTTTLTGYGIRFIRTPEYDHAVETYLVEYSEGSVTRISTPQRCDLFRPTCTVMLTAKGNNLSATINHTDRRTGEPKSQTLEASMPHPNSYAGFHLQHTGSTGASATVVKSIVLKP